MTAAGGLGWVVGFEPTATGTTIQRSTKLSYTHREGTFLSYQAVAGAANLQTGLTNGLGGSSPAGIIESMLSRYIREAMKKARYKTLKNGACFGQVPGLAGVWVNESTLEECRETLQDVLEEWLVLKIRDNDPIPRLGRVRLPVRAA